jgi:glutamate racemase
MPHLLVFDSGIGGLGVARHIRRLQPGARLTYLADNGFYPYGEKPDAALTQRIIGVIAAGMAAVKPDAVVIACNTASTIALAPLREAFAAPFIGCVPPVKPAAAASRTRQIGLLATAATTRRPYLQGLVGAFAGGCAVHTLGTPVLADLAEQKFRGVAVDLARLQSVIAPLFQAAPQIDCVAIGCTHYTFLLPEFGSIRPDISWFDPALAVARQTLNITAGLPASPAGGGEIFLNTAPFPDHPVMARRLAGYGFGEIRTLLI